LVFFVFLNSSKLDSSPPPPNSSIITLRFDMLMNRKAPELPTHETLFCCSASFSSLHPPQCLFVCLPLALFIASEFRPDILHLWGGCFFPFLFFLLCEHCLCVPLHIHLCFGPIFINYLSCILFIDERRGRPSQTATSKSALGKKK
jgi:hypothetical protein